MDRYTRITIPLSADEFFALRNIAEKDYRHPRDQARFILRSVLLSDDIKGNENTGAMVVEARAGVVKPTN